MRLTLRFSKLTTIQCESNCGLSAYITIYGGYDWQPFQFNYIHGGFRVQDANFNVLLRIESAQGYSASFKKGLSKVPLVEIGVPVLLNVAPTVSLDATVSFDLSTGGFNVANLGVVYQQQEDMVFEVDFLNRHITQSGWDNVAPQWQQPLIQNIPSALSLKASIGPALGLEIQALSKW